MKSLHVFVFGFLPLALSAQTWVQVPDANFQAYLTANYSAGAFMTSGPDFYVDANFPDIQNASALNVNGLGVSSLEGIQAFQSLSSLFCNNNALTSLPNNLPASLTNLVCNNNNISSIQSLPNSLTVFYCENNLLTSLPTLPLNLQVLVCSGNQLASLPAVLPNGITSLDCDGNPITQLPNLPAALESLDCTGCALTELPTLPPNLEVLGFNGVDVVELPVLPQSLTHLSFSNTSITSLPPLPDGLTSLQIPDNIHLVDIGVLPEFLVNLDCSNNEISCFSPFPVSIQNFLIGGNPFSCLHNYIPAMNSFMLAYPLCNESDPVHNPNGCQSAMGIQGSVFDDVNNDCVDAGIPVIYVPMTLSDDVGNLLTSSTSTNLVNGDYYFTTEEGDYQVSVNTTTLNPSIQVNCPATNLQTATITQAVPVVDAGDFGLTCSGFDLGVQSVVSTGWVFPGETHEINILAGDLAAQYNMHCATGLSGDVTITVSGPGVISFGGTPTVTGNTAVYSIADFGAIGANFFSASILTDTTAQSDDDFCITVSVTTSASGDLDATNDIYTYCYSVVNSYDPNIKETYPELVESCYTDEFTYTIHFQNTGNAPAMNIRLADTLDSNLDWSTLKFVNASHEFTTSVNAESRLLTVHFQNIMLPDSASNPDGSIGYIQYRVKPISSLPNGTYINNTAHIYFDYNSPIATNTTYNWFSSVGLEEKLVDEIMMYPNPSKDKVTVESKNLLMEQILVYDLNGTLVKRVESNALKSNLDVSNLKAGMYLVKVQTPTGIINSRLIIND